MLLVVIRILDFIQSVLSKLRYQEGRIMVQNGVRYPNRHMLMLLLFMTFLYHSLDPSLIFTVVMS